MTNSARHDAWKSADNYERYMGRWSRKVAPRFLDWLQAPQHADWLEVGCGTGALTEAIVANCAPATVTAIDPSTPFLDKARSVVANPLVSFMAGDAQSLPLPLASKDVVVSGLALNFVPDRPQALAEMRRVARPDGIVAFYVWDYPGGGVQFMRAFWTAAKRLDPSAADLTEDRRFPFCTEEGLRDLAVAAGLTTVETARLEVPSVFRDFQDLWEPFTLGAGPAPGYCASLAPDARERLRTSLQAALPVAADGSIPLVVRAWGVRGRVP